MTFDNRPSPTRLAAHCKRKGIAYDETRDATATVIAGTGINVREYATTETALYLDGKHVGNAYADRQGRVHFKAAP